MSPSQNDTRFAQIKALTMQMIMLYPQGALLKSVVLYADAAICPHFISCSIRVYATAQDVVIIDIIIWSQSCTPHASRPPHSGQHKPGVYQDQVPGPEVSYCWNKIISLILQAAFRGFRLSSSNCLTSSWLGLFSNRSDSHSLANRLHWQGDKMTWQVFSSALAWDFVNIISDRK
ncbi:unnamed protein product [Eretmochelys imbricata]